MVQIQLYILTWVISIISCQDSIFYPFGVQNGDNLVPKVDDGFVGPISISTSFPFFEKSPSELFVNTNGLISFFQSVTAYVPNPFPLPDTVCVAPFWSDIDNRVGGDIFYQEITNPALLNRISVDIRQAFSTFFNFRTTWAFIATWHEVAEYGTQNPMVNNTFQVILATNGKHSFTIFNYQELMWPVLGYIDTTTIYTNMNDYFHQRLAQAGFNAGDSKTFFVLPGSFSSKITELPNLSNVNVPGKWIFRVDSSQIEESGCNTGGYLTVTPNKVYYFGGDHVIISGPCYNDINTYKIMFDDQSETTCIVLDASRSVCKVPFLKKIGRIRISMSINGNYTFFGFIFSKDISLELEIKGIKMDYISDNLGLETISWKQPQNVREDETYQIVYINIHEPTYRTVILELKDKAMSNGSIIDLEKIIQERLFATMPLAFIVVRQRHIFIKTSENITYYTNIAANSIYLRSSFEQDPEEACIEWHNRQQNVNVLQTASEPCWRFLALNRDGSFPDAFSVFMQDPKCNPKNPESCSIFYPQAKICYKSMLNINNGIEQQCCYSSNGSLLVGPPSGGSLHIPHRETDILSYFNENIKPYFWCCIHSQNCNLYHERRPSDNGSRWQEPVIGGGRGIR